MRKLSIHKKLSLIIWKYLMTFKRTWYDFLLELLAKSLIIFLAAQIFKNGLDLKPIWPTDEADIMENLQIYYTPDTPFTNELIEKLRRNPHFNTATINPEKNEEAIIKRWHKVKDKSEKDRNIIGIIFLNATNTTLIYKIRLSDPLEKSTYKFTQEPFHNFWRIHFAKFLLIQCAIDSAYVSHISEQNIKIPLPESVGGSIEYDPEHKARILHKFTCWFGIFICTTAFCSIVHEKESMEKEHLGVMGINPNFLWIGRFIEMVTKALFSNALVCFILTTDLNVHWYWLWIFLIIYTTKVSAILFFMSVFFRNSVTALMSALTFWVLGGVVGQILVVYPPKGDIIVRLVASFFMPNTGLALGYLLLAKMEAENAQSGIHPQSQYRRELIEMITVKITSTIVFWLLAMYLDPMLQPEKGADWKPWPFRSPSRRSNISEEPSTRIEAHFPPINKNMSLPFQEPPMRAHPEISFRNITKRMRVAKKFFPKLNKVNLDIFKNEITVLLGENGSGKTMVISMITGWKMPSTGKILVSGLDATRQDNLEIIRANVGWCPQENRLLSGLSIKELFIFACKLRRMSDADTNRETHIIMKALALRHIQDKVPSEMPHSVLRRVCFAFAILGRPRIILLDEPATGVDITWRRKILKLIKGLRGNRVIFLATNQMDDAEEISDRVIFLKEGKVVCWGTPRFLKNHFNCGFHLSVERSISVRSSSIKAVILKYFPTAKRGFSKLGQIVFGLPKSSPQKVSRLMRELRALGVKYLVLTSPNMEEVFLKVSKKRKRKNTDIESVVEDEEGVLLIKADISQHPTKFRALLKKELLHVVNAWPLYVLAAILLLVSISYIISVSEWKVDVGMKSPVDILLRDYRGFVLYDQYENAMPNLQDSYEVLVKESHSSVSEVPNIESKLREEEAKDRLATHMKYHVGAHLASQNTLENELVPGTPVYTRAGTLSPAVSVNLLSNAVLRALQFQETRIYVTDEPLPETWYVPALELFGTMLWEQSMVLVMGIWLVSFGRVACEERLWNTQLRQQAAGAPPHLYWLARFVCHLCIHTVMVGLQLVSTIAQKRSIFSCPSVVEALFTIWLIYGVAGIPFIYFLTQILSLEGFIKWIIVVVTAATAYDDVYRRFPEIHPINPYVSPIGNLFPTYVIRESLSSFHKMVLKDSPCRLNQPSCEGKQDEKDTPQHQECLTLRYYNKLLAHYYYVLLVQSFVYLVIVIMKDYTRLWLIFQRIRHRSKLIRWKNEDLNEGPDVEVERDLAQEAYEEVLRERKLPKWQRATTWPVYTLVANKARAIDAHYRCCRLDRKSRSRSRRRRRLAIPDIEAQRERGRESRRKRREEKEGPPHDLSLRVRAGESLALLGPDLSGATILLMTMAGRLRLARGDVVGIGGGVRRRLTGFLRNLGYCPYKGGLIPHLTTKQHLELYCSLRGIRYNDFIQKWGPVFDLDSILSHPVRALSPGRKRMLAIVLAMIGMPSAILLDRPSWSMDPASRCKLVNAINILTDRRRSVVLTENRFSEVSALCRRVVLIRAGRITRIGTVGAVRDKMRLGYDVTFEIEEDVGVEGTLRNNMNNSDTFQGTCKFTGSERGKATFFIKDPNLLCDNLIEGLEKVKITTKGVLYWNFKETSPIEFRASKLYEKF